MKASLDFDERGDLVSLEILGAYAGRLSGPILRPRAESSINVASRRNRVSSCLALHSSSVVA